MESIPADTLAIDPVPASDDETRPHFTIKPVSGWVPLHLREMWVFRDLMFALAGRDIKLRYKQTALGVVWVVLNPLLSAGVVTFVFGTVAGIKIDLVPYIVFAFAGQMTWTLFNSVLTKAAGSLVGNANLISKVFFPRLILPLSALPSSLVDFAISVVVMAVLMATYHIQLHWGLVLLPLWLTILMFYAIGIGLFATSLMVTYRDVGYVLPVVLNILQYACPIVYPASKVPNKALFWYHLNPMATVFEAIDWSLFGMGALDWNRIAIATAAGVLCLVFGVYSFKYMEQKFADVI